MLDQIGIWKPGHCLELVVLFLQLLVGSFSLWQGTFPCCRRYGPAIRERMCPEVVYLVCNGVWVVSVCEVSIDQRFSNRTLHCNKMIHSLYLLVLIIRWLISVNSWFLRCVPPTQTESRTLYTTANNKRSDSETMMLWTHWIDVFRVLKSVNSVTY